MTSVVFFFFLKKTRTEKKILECIPHVRHLFCKTTVSVIHIYICVHLCMYWFVIKYILTTGHIKNSLKAINLQFIYSFKNLKFL